jgi:hypothetical protein
MEAIMVGGVAVLAIGGYFSIVDFMNDLGLGRRTSEKKVNSSRVSRFRSVTPQTSIKKMTWMHI